MFPILWHVVNVVLASGVRYVRSTGAALKASGLQFQLLNKEAQQ